MYSNRGLLNDNAPLAWTIIIVVIAIAILHIVATWKIFEKAGKPGWAAIIPIYATIVWVQVSRKPMWWAAVVLLGGIVPVVGPIVQLVGGIIVAMAVGKNFGKSDGFGVVMGIFPFIVRPILAFSDAKYDESDATESDDLLDA